MKTSKILTALLALALMLSLFACGDKPEETTTGTPDATTNTEAATTLDVTKETTEAITTDETTEETTLVETTEVTTEETTVTETETAANETTIVTTESESVTETETETESKNETESQSETGSESEETTRFDYFGADMNEYASLESGALETVEIEISSEFLIDENDVKEYVDNIRLELRQPLNNGAQVTDQAIKYGDSAYIYYHGTINGEAFEGGSNWDESMPEELAIGMGYFIEEIENQLIGIVPSSTSKEAPAKLSVTFPENYWEESLAGTEAVFDIWVVYTVQYELPEYNEEFILNTLGYEPEEGCTDVVASFEASILAELKEESAYWEEYEKEAALREYLLNIINVIKYPESELEYYYNEVLSYFEEMKEYYEESYEQPFDSLEDFILTMLELEEGEDWQAVLMEEYVYPSVKQHLMIHVIAEELDITVTNEDCQAYIEEILQGSDMTTEEIIERLGGEYMLKETVLLEKITEAVRERAVFYYEQ